MLASAVSSKMLAAMARVHGFEFHETLTGFKWLGNRAKDLIDQGKTFLFAFEEAIGFMIGDICLDKDGVRAAGVFAELTNHVYHQQHLTLSGYLQSLYQKYGTHSIETKYIRVSAQSDMTVVFDRLKTGTGPSATGVDLGPYVRYCGEHAIVRVRDQDTGYDSGEADRKTQLPVTPGSPMITFTFANGCVATLRGSGTEPKLKYYVEAIGADRAAAEAQLRLMQRAVEVHFLNLQ
jgi:phosphomannomutase